MNFTSLRVLGAMLTFLLLCPEMAPAQSLDSRRVDQTILTDVDAVAAAFGVTPEWSEDRQVVTLKNQTASVQFALGGFLAVANRQLALLEAAPFREEQRTFIPLRLTVETLGGRVQWEPVTQRLTVEALDQTYLVVVQKPLPLPADPFERLLYRLDRAPFDLAALEVHAQQGMEIQQAAEAFTTIMEPVTPILEKMGDSKILALLGDLPLIGKPIQVVQHSLGAVAELTRGFKWLVDQDKRLNQPLRDAVRASARLQRTRQRSDLPATVKALEGTKEPLLIYEQQAEKQARILALLTTALDKLAPLAEKYAGMPAQGPGSIAEVKTSLAEVSLLLTAGTREVRALRQYTQACVEDGRAALKR